MTYITEELFNLIESEDAWDQIDYVLTDYTNTTNEELLEILKSGQEYDPSAICTALNRLSQLSYEEFDLIETANETAIELLEAAILPYDPDNDPWINEKIHYAKTMVDYTNGMTIDEALYLVEAVKRLSDENVRLLEEETADNWESISNYRESNHNRKFDRLLNKLDKYGLTICQGWIRYQIAYATNDDGAVEVLVEC